MQGMNNIKDIVVLTIVTF